MKRIRCLKVSYNTPENGNAYCGVRHGYFQLGVFDCGKVSNFFIKKLGRLKKDENDPNHGISRGKAYKNIASTVCY